MTPEVYAKRREALKARLGPDAVAVVPAWPEHLRNGDSEFPYRADSDLAWLTGFREPEAVAVISTSHAQDFVLFVLPRDKERETWTGRRAGIAGAQERFGARVAYTVEELEAKLPQYLADAQTLHYRLAANEAFDRRLLAILAGMRRKARLKGHPPYRIEDLSQALHELRLFKAPEEVAALEQAASITAHAHRAVMQQARPGMREYELQAVLEFHYRKAGGEPGYQPIVASGANATILHYHSNDAVLTPDSLLLVDSGCERELYTADVTRTFPVGGRFSPEQRALYELVLASQQAAFAMCKPGETLPAIHKRVCEVLTRGLVELGLLKGDPAELQEQGAFRRYYMHGTSHWLGLDVHDAGRYDRGGGEPRLLAPGLVFTVEPGLYVAEDDPQAPAAFRGLGVRIEDDVLITEAGHRVLTGEVPTAVAEIEALTARA